MNRVILAGSRSSEVRLLFGRSVLLTDRSGFGVHNRPVGDQGETRPGITDFGNPIHETLDRVIMLVSQAINLDLAKFNHRKTDHGVEYIGMTGQALNRAESVPDSKRSLLFPAVLKMYV
jgi:hypothetical protein